MIRSLVPNEMLGGEFLFRRYGATVADYERAANEDTRLELLDGVMIMHSPASVRHEDVFAFLLVLLRGYTSASRLGRVFGSRTSMYLDEGRRFEPDLLFIAQKNLARLGEVALSGPADLVIEILSPATREYDLGEKRQAYAEGGLPEYWMVDPMAKRLLVDRPAGTRHREVASGRYETPVLPDFWLDVAWLWADPLPDSAACLAQIQSSE
jgi:Uma2 family endonuclease